MLLKPHDPQAHTPTFEPKKKKIGSAGRARIANSSVLTVYTVLRSGKT